MQMDDKKIIANKLNYYKTGKNTKSIPEIKESEMYFENEYIRFIKVENSNNEQNGSGIDNGV